MIFYGISLFVFRMDPGGELPGNPVMESPLAEADPVGAFPGNAVTDPPQNLNYSDVAKFHKFLRTPCG